MIHKTTRSILSVLLAALLLVTSTPLTPAFAGGGGVSLPSESGEGRALEQADDGVYQISTAAELKEFRDEVNSGKTDADAVLTANIDLSEICSEEEGVSWTPIGNSESTAYSGTFNGDGHTISGLYIDSSDNDYKGLFGYLSTDGNNTGTVQNLTVSGSVSGGWYVGGVVGRNGGNVINCTFSGSVSGHLYVGGVVGQNGGTVENCYNTGSVSGNSVGGVVGYNSSTVENCYNIGEVSGSPVGGVVGYNDEGRVENCYNTGAVSGVEEVGGVVGNNYNGSVENSYNTGAVSGVEGVGGVVGQNFGGTVENCYNTGTVTGTDDYVGGVVGWNVSGGTVTGCYFLKDTAGSGIGVNEGNDSADATPVDDLDALCEKFENDPGWSIHPVLGRPVLNENKEGGDGLPDSPYEISTADQLENFRNLVNRGGAGASAHAKLMNNINLKDVCGPELNDGSSVSWTPIGSISSRYTGTFNGNGHKIENLYINTTDSGADNQGLFGGLDQGGTVKVSPSPAQSAAAIMSAASSATTTVAPSQAASSPVPAASAATGMSAALWGITTAAPSKTATTPAPSTAAAIMSAALWGGTGAALQTATTPATSAVAARAALWGITTAAASQAAIS